MRYSEIYEAVNQALLEVKMSPGALRKAAAMIDARAGMEFEMVIPNFKTASDGVELEANYDEDTSADDIDDIINFFDDSDYNSRIDLRRARENMRERFAEWASEKADAAFSKNVDLSDYAEWFKYNGDWEAGEDESEDDAVMRAAEESWDSGDRDFDTFREEWLDNSREELSEEDWLRDIGVRRMSDAESEFSLTWPHYISLDNSGKFSELADDFEHAVGRTVHWSTDYHGAQRTPTAYSMEPDGSIDGDHDDDGGIEFISPPLPVSEMLDDLRKIKRWAGIYGAYSNDSTGLHMNVSVPNLSPDTLDYVKLALFLGDEYVLDQFGRLGNTYAASAMSKLRDRVMNLDAADSVAVAFDAIKGGLLDLASKVIRANVGHSKYTSIHDKGGYIEFRSPGGDWLDTDIDKLEQTLLRMVVAVDIACDPNKYKQEYAKKLYKLLSLGQQDNDMIGVFSNYTAGVASSKELAIVLKGRHGRVDPQVVADAYLKRQAQILDFWPDNSNYTSLRWWRVEAPKFPAAHGKVVLSSMDTVSTSKLESSIIMSLQRAGENTATNGSVKLKVIGPFDVTKPPPK